MSGINSRTNSGLRYLQDTHLEGPLVSGELKGFSRANITGFQHGEFETLSNENGPLEVNTVSTEDPLVVENQNGACCIKLEMDETCSGTCLRVNSSGALEVIPGVRQTTIKPASHRIVAQQIWRAFNFADTVGLHCNGTSSRVVKDLQARRTRSRKKDGGDAAFLLSFTRSIRTLARGMRNAVLVELASVCGFLDAISTGKAGVSGPEVVS
ncbi:hypothetical protein DFS34DRAFT_639747 [Phlyctochytrium arcticum]|nr:hypothetical protein DFS34DRAFT_639747 [Phlyctochytrium arcticum]